MPQVRLWLKAVSGERRAGSDSLRENGPQPVGQVLFIACFSERFRPVHPMGAAGFIWKGANFMKSYGLLVGVNDTAGGIESWVFCPEENRLSRLRQEDAFPKIS